MREIQMLLVKTSGYRITTTANHIIHSISEMDVNPNIFFKNLHNISEQLCSIIWM